MFRTHYSWLATILFLIVPGVAVSAQTTLFNTPTAETLPRGSVNVEFDFLARPVPYRDGGFDTYGYRLAYGLNRKTEIGTNFYLTWDGSESNAQAELSLKRNFYLNEKRGVSASGGVVVFIPLRAGNRDRTSVMVYGVSRKSINRLKGMAVSGGAYRILGGPRDYGTRTGAIVGINQPITKRIAFVADWFSGSNRIGYSSAGVTINVTKRQYLTTGYSFGNSGRGNNSFAAYYGVIF